MRDLTRNATWPDHRMMIEPFLVNRVNRPRTFVPLLPASDGFQAEAMAKAKGQTVGEDTHRSFSEISLVEFRDMPARQR